MNIITNTCRFKTFLMQKKLHDYLFLLYSIVLRISYVVACHNVGTKKGGGITPV